MIKNSYSFLFRLPVKSSNRYEDEQERWSASFFTYFLLFTLFVVIAFFIWHNKNKVKTNDYHQFRLEKENGRCFFFFSSNPSFRYCGSINRRMQTWSLSYFSIVVFDCLFVFFFDGSVYLFFSLCLKLMIYAFEGRREGGWRTGSQPSHRNYEKLLRNMNDVIPIDEINPVSDK